jgi:O-antigen/teichoic acid export membrane protein
VIVALVVIIFALALALWFALNAAENPVWGIVVGAIALVALWRYVAGYRRWRERDAYLQRRWRKSREGGEP